MAILVSILVCVLQHVAVCCSVSRQTLKPQSKAQIPILVCVLQHVAVCCSVRRQTLKPQDIKGTDANFSVCVAACCSVLQCP